MHKYRILLILGFRYLYGLRSLAPFVFALCGVKPLQFLLLNGIGALIWAVSMGALGYLLGNAVEPLLKLFDNLAIAVFAGLAVLLAAVAVYLVYRRKAL
jgi:membrane protein DedA with SNARE-associated domain